MPDVGNGIARCRRGSDGGCAQPNTVLRSGSCIKRTKRNGATPKASPGLGHFSAARRGAGRRHGALVWGVSRPKKAPALERACFLCGLTGARGVVPRCRRRYLHRRFGLAESQRLHRRSAVGRAHVRGTAAHCAHRHAFLKAAQRLLAQRGAAICAARKQRPAVITQGDL